MRNNIKNKTYSLILCGLFAALIAVGAFIKIPLPNMNYITLQVLFVILAGLLLGPVKAAVSVLVYILIGLAGVPIFAGGGGWDYIFKPTFGYLIGFVFGAFVVGYISKKLKNKTFKNLLFASLIGVLVIYLIGIPYHYLILNLYIGKIKGLWVIVASFFPFAVPGDILKCIAGAYLAKRLLPIINNF